MPTGQQNDNGFKTFTAGAALEQFRCVKLDTTANQVVYSGAGEVTIGVTQDRAASGDPVCVKLITAPGTFVISCASTVAAIGTALYTAANGQVDDAASGTAKFHNMEVVASANGQIECARYLV